MQMFDSVIYKITEQMKGKLPTPYPLIILRIIML